MNDIYEQKALKYKHKYLQLKAQIQYIGEGGYKWYNPFGLKKPNMLKNKEEIAKTAAKKMPKEVQEAPVIRELTEEEKACNERIKTGKAFIHFKENIGKELEYTFRQQTDEGEKENKRLMDIVNYINDDKYKDEFRRRGCETDEYYFAKIDAEVERINKLQAERAKKIQEQQLKKQLKEEEELEIKYQEMMEKRAQIQQPQQPLIQQPQIQQPPPQWVQFEEMIHREAENKNNTNVEPQKSQPDLLQPSAKDLAYYEEMKRRYPKLYEFRAGPNGS